MKSKTTAADSISTHGDAGWTLLFVSISEKISLWGVSMRRHKYIRNVFHSLHKTRSCDGQEATLGKNVYQTKSSTEVSWYEPDPKQSLDLILQVSGPSRGRVIDIGGGQSFLVDKLLDSGFSHIAVLDISQTAIEATKARLGNRALQVEWIVADITRRESLGEFDIWHDRAVSTSSPFRTSEGFTWIC